MKGWMNYILLVQYIVSEALIYIKRQRSINYIIRH